MKKHKQLFILLLIGLLAFPAYGQRKNKKKNKEKEKTEEAQSSFDAKKFSALKWRNIGPYRGGRSNTVSGVRGDENTYYAGYTGGGIWKTENAGQSWQNISDGFLKSGSVGDIAVSETDPNVIYAGMGEHAVRGVMTTFGDGVYKSVDAGQSWVHLGLDSTRHISDVVIHPNDPNTVFVAAQGAVHGPSTQRGVYKSTDGGKTWKKTLYVDEDTGASSLSIDYNNPRILYAATWDHRRTPWTVRSGGPGSAIYKSTDGGETWNKIINGLPAKMGKIGVSVSRADSKRVFAIVESEKKEAGLYRSDNGGNSWRHLSNDQDITSRSWYYMEVFADPVNADVVYVLNAPMMRSIDGGNTFERVNVGHGDTHDLWINPDNNRNMILGDDGGAEITFNTGMSWSTLYNQPTAQFYRVNTDNLFPYNVYGGQQDNSSVVISSRTSTGGISDKDWFSGPGCESAYIAFDPDNPIILYGGCYQGIINRLDTRTKQGKDIQEYPALHFAREPKDLKYRFNWNAPIVASPHDPTTIYHAGNVVFKTQDGGITWDVISPDLTRNDTTKQGKGGGPFTNEGAGGENYNTIYYLTESELEAGVIYTGSDCGLVHVTRNGGESWENITPPTLPESSIHSIEVSPHDKGTAYISANRYKFNDFRAMAYKTTDYGKTWTAINNGIQDEDFLRVIREDTKRPGLLYGGGERGFYISFDGGEKWERFQLNLPVVPVTDLTIQDNDLVAATQGRAFWILDDLSALQESEEIMEEEPMVQVFDPKTTVLFGGGRGRGPQLGDNPPYGVILDYYLKEAATDSMAATLEIMDAQGKVIRSFSSKKDEDFETWTGGPRPPQTIPARAGLNRFAWNFATETLPGVPGSFLYGSYQGHTVPPGTYKARLTVGESTSEAEVEIVADPRVEVDPAAWEEQQRVVKRIENHIKDIHGAINDMARVKKQINAYNELLEDQGQHKELYEAGMALLEKIENWEAQLIERRQKNTQDVINWPSKLNADFFTIKSAVDGFDPVVTQGVMDRLGELEEQWEAAQEELDQLMEEDIAAYNKAFEDKKIPALITTIRP
ncbi:MAG TPA: hypothetical protein VJ953_02020 [Saprospiraceae bacterium]|nr:hypothetical protein [Saprospiraceae bacterium]